MFSFFWLFGFVCSVFGYGAYVGGFFGWFFCFWVVFACCCVEVIVVVDFFDFYVFVFDVFSFLECFLYVWW